jgi:hypothetical protein
MTAAAVVAVGATTESASAAGSKDLFFSQSNAMANETIEVEGVLSTPLVRTVRLQYRTGTSGSWTTRLTTKSAADGSFFFAVKNTKTRYWRYSVPAGGGKPAVVGNAKRLAVVPQKVEYFGATYDCDFNGNNIVTAWADFYPAREDRQVSFQTPEGVKFDAQDSRGIARVTIVTTDVGGQPLQATSIAYDGAAAKSSLSTMVDLPHCAPA